MNKVEKYEMLFVRFTWVFVLLGLINVLLNEYLGIMNTQENFGIYTDILFFVMAGIFNFAKYYVVSTGKINSYKFYFWTRFFELLLVSFAIEYIGIGLWAYSLFALIVMKVGLSKGNKMGLIVLSQWLVIYIGIKLSKIIFFSSIDLDNVVNVLFSEKTLMFVFFYIINTSFVLFCGLIYKDNLNADQENSRLLKELEEKYEQIAIAQNEIEYHYEKMKDANSKLEDTNQKLTTSIAEFYTLQQISQAISSILDIKELLKFVNDIIIGVMGVNNSTIALYDEKRNRLKVHTTNIREQSELVTMTDNINSPILLDALKNAKPIIENFVDQAEYEFALGREIRSLICVPFNTKSRRFGLVLIEHKYNNAFDENNVRLLDIIGQQVGIAMENAELYQKMQELATIDGLTGIYNRLYFQEKLKKEIQNAQDEGYRLSLAIFDIDHFKRFNDTYGHLFGDKVLKNISTLVKDSLRSSDILARYGGEEFIIMFPRTGPEDAYEKVEKLRQEISKTLIQDNLVSSSVTVSFGISCYPDYASNEAELLRSADDALYEAKAAGRNCATLTSGKSKANKMR